MTTRHRRIALLTGAAPKALAAACGGGVPIKDVWLDVAGEIFRGHDALAFSDDLAAEIAGSGDMF